MQTINVSEFKAKCLALLDEVARNGEGIVILKRGKPVARVVPVSGDGDGFPQDALKGTVKVLGDIVGPALPAGEWKAEKGRG